MTGGLTALDREVVAPFMREWEQLFDDGDYRRMTSFYTEEAVIIAAQREIAAGRSMIEEFWRTACDGANSAGVRRTVHLDAVECSGQLGYLRGSVLLRVPGAAEVAHIRYVTIWRRRGTTCGGSRSTSLRRHTRHPPRARGPERVVTATSRSRRHRCTSRWSSVIRTEEAADTREERRPGARPPVD